MAEKIPLAVRRTIGDTTALEEFSASDTLPLGNLPTLPLNKLAPLTASRVLVTGAGGIIEASAVTAIELGYLSGVTSSIQTQLNTAASNLSSHTGNTSNPHLVTAAQVGAPTTSGAGATGTWGIGINGNATTATIWATGRTLTVGDTGKSVDGSGNVSWSHSEIGATTTNTANKIVLRDADGAAQVGRITNTGALGSGGFNARNHFQQYNLGSAEITAGWIAAAFGDTTGDRVVIGQASGATLLGAHNGDLSAWASLSLQASSYVFKNASDATILGVDSTGLITSQADTFRLVSARTPASASATGSAGDMCWDASYFYICTATNTWRRIAHATW